MLFFLSHRYHWFDFDLLDAAGTTFPLRMEISIGLDSQEAHTGCWGSVWTRPDSGKENLLDGHGWRLVTFIRDAHKENESDIFLNDGESWPGPGAVVHHVICQSSLSASRQSRIDCKGEEDSNSMQLDIGSSAPASASASISAGSSAAAIRHQCPNPLLDFVPWSEPAFLLPPHLRHQEIKLLHSRYQLPPPRPASDLMEEEGNPNMEEKQAQNADPETNLTEEEAKCWGDVKVNFYPDCQPLRMIVRAVRFLCTPSVLRIVSLSPQAFAMSLWIGFGRNILNSFLLMMISILLNSAFSGFKRWSRKPLLLQLSLSHLLPLSHPHSEKAQFLLPPLLLLLRLLSKLLHHPLLDRCLTSRLLLPLPFLHLSLHLLRFLLPLLLLHFLFFLLPPHLRFLASLHFPLLLLLLLFLHFHLPLHFRLRVFIHIFPPSLLFLHPSLLLDSLWALLSRRSCHPLSSPPQALFSPPLCLLLL